MRAAWVAAAATVLAACGGASEPVPLSKAAWTARYAEAIETVNADLEVARATLSSLQRPDILGDCNSLRDSLGEARKALPVPDATSDAALRAGLDQIALGVEDCIQGARGPNIPQLEKSFGELRQARALMEVAGRTLAAWE
jgi:hypothetical protein